MSTLSPNVVSITPWSYIESIGAKLEGSNCRQTSLASTVWPATNAAIYVPFVLTCPMTVALLFCSNGATVNGNVDVGIYSSSGVRIISAGSTAQAGTSTLQTFNVTDTVLGAGLYRMALASDSATATFLSSATGLLGTTKVTGVLSQTSAFVLPATSTMVTMAYDYVPYFGLTTRSVI